MQKLCLALLGGILIVFGALVPWTVPRPCPVTKAAFERIEVGMSLVEAEAILGGPEGDYCTEAPGVVLVDISSPMRADDDPPPSLLRWHGDEGSVHLEVDSTGQVVGKDFIENNRSAVGLVERAQWRFKRWWDRVFGATP
jgi:hypothetical protein